LKEYHEKNQSERKFWQNEGLMKSIQNILKKADPEYFNTVEHPQSAGGFCARLM